MATVNEDLLDHAIRHQIGLQRYTTSIVQKIIALLNKTDADIVAHLQKFDPSEAGGTFSKKRLEKLLVAVRTVNRDAYDLVNKGLAGELSAFSEYEAAFQVKALLASLPVELNIVTPTAEQLFAAVAARPFQGRLLKDWGKDLEETTFGRIRDAIRMGYVEGQTTEEIVRRIMGTRANRFADGLLQTNRRSVEMVVATAIAHTSNVARQEIYRANSDVVASWRFVATLDHRTTLICINLDGKTFEIGEGPQPPRHPRCRSTSVPVTKSWKELGFDIDELPPGTRASMNGQVPADLTYPEWLKKQPHHVVEDVLGAERAALYRTGGLDVDKFVDKTGKTLTLDQLKKKDAEAFEKAGLNNPVRPPRGEPQDEIARFLDDPVAQRQLLERVMGNLEGHIDAVEVAIEEQGWSATVEPLLGIRHYTGSAYGGLNNRAREGLSTLEDREITALISKGLGELPDFEDAVWRAPAKNSALAERLWATELGQTLDIGKQVLSFSADQAFASRWASGTNLLFRIEIPREGAYVEPITLNPGEHEVLFPAGMRFRVKGKAELDIRGQHFRVVDLEIDAEE